MPANIPMVSEVSICNQALGWLGQSPIISLDDRSKTAELCKQNYAFIRDAVIEERMWTFAKGRFRSETQNRDEWGIQYVHAIPQDWIGVYRVYNYINGRDDKRTSRGWDREGDFIIANESVVYLEGTVRVTDTSKFTPMFVQCLATRIAADLAIPITQSEKQQGIQWQLYSAKLEEAAVRDGQQGSNEHITQRQLINVRYQSGPG